MEDCLNQPMCYELRHQLLNRLNQIPEEKWFRNNLVVIKNKNGARRVSPEAILGACSPTLQKLLEEAAYPDSRVKFASETLEKIVDFIFFGQPILCTPKNLLEYSLAAELLELEDLTKLIRNEFYRNLGTYIKSADFLIHYNSTEHLSTLADMIDQLELSELAKKDMESILHSWMLEHHRPEDDLVVARLMKTIRKPLETAYIVYRNFDDENIGVYHSIRNVCTSEETISAFEFPVTDLQNSVISFGCLLTVENNNLVKYDLRSGEEIAKSRGYVFCGLTVFKTDIFIYTETDIYLVLENSMELFFKWILSSPTPIRRMYVMQEFPEQTTFLIQNWQVEIWFLTVETLRNRRGESQGFSGNVRNTGVLKDRHLAGVHNDHVFLFHCMKGANYLIDYWRSQESQRHQLEHRSPPTYWSTCGKHVFYKYPTVDRKLEYVIVNMDEGEMRGIPSEEFEESKILSVLPGLM